MLPTLCRSPSLDLAAADEKPSLLVAPSQRDRKVQATWGDDLPGSLGLVFADVMLFIWQSRWIVGDGPPNPSLYPSIPLTTHTYSHISFTAPLKIF